MSSEARKTEQEELKSSSSHQHITKIFSHPTEQRTKVLVVGGGWFGAETAIRLAGSGFETHIYEKNERIFSGISGNFGVRVHTGPHHPRSFLTRAFCKAGLYEMLHKYPQLCYPLLHAFYANGLLDADNLPSKVSDKAFKSVCNEISQYKSSVELEESFFKTSGISSAHDIDERCAIVGERLRSFFEKHLKESKVLVTCGTTVLGVNKVGKVIQVKTNHGTQQFDFIVDATGFKQKFLPLTKPLPHKSEVIYQPCLALIYRDKKPGEKPISSIVMDGWFPCFMPYDDRAPGDSKPIDKYIMTHGKETILGSYENLDEAEKRLAVTGEKFVQTKIRPNFEKEFSRYYKSKLTDRFAYTGFKGEVLPKIKTESEFRGSVVFEEPKIGMICIFPGKITNIFAASNEVHSLISARLGNKNDSILTSESGYRYIKGGTFSLAKDEIEEPIKDIKRNTCHLQTYRDNKDSLTSKQPTTASQSTHIKYLTLALSIIGLYVLSQVYKDDTNSKHTELATYTLLLPLAFLLYKSTCKVTNYFSPGIFGRSKETPTKETPISVPPSSQHQL